MSNRRPPSPELIAAKLWEIKRRYDRKAKVGRRTKGMAAIRIADLTKWLSDAVGAGVELGPCKWSEDVARVFVHHFVVLSDGNRRAAQWMHDYCPWIRTRDREYMITEANHCPIKWTADRLAWKIRLTDAKRTELGITTIGAIDCNKDQRLIRRNKRKAERERARRAAKRAAKAVSTI